MAEHMAFIGHQGSSFPRLDRLLTFSQIDDDPEEMMRRLAETLNQVDSGTKFAWKDKVVLGFWTVTTNTLSSRRQSLTSTRPNTSPSAPRTSQAFPP